MYRVRISAAISGCRRIWQGFQQQLAAGVALSWLIFSQASAAPAHAATVPHIISSESWYAGYLQGRPIGGDHESEQAAMLDGHWCVLSVSASATAVVVIGTSVRQQVSSRTWSDPVSRRPLREEIVMTSGGVTTKVTATFTLRQVRASLDSGGRAEPVTLAIPPGATLVADDPTLSFPQDGHKAQEKRSYVYFDPETLSLAPVTISQVTNNGEQQNLAQVRGLKLYRVVMPSGAVIVIEDAAGETIRVDLPAELSMSRVGGLVAAAYIAQAANPLAQPLSSGQREPSAPDFAAETSVVPAGAPLLPSPVTLQAEVTLASGETRIFRLRDIVPPTQEQIADFTTVGQVQASGEYRAQLADAPYLGLGDPSIRLQASELAAGTANTYEIAMRIEDWLHRIVTPTASLEAISKVC